MTLGELKINCYRIIDPSDTQMNASDIISVYEQDTAYSFYFLNMQNSINSAITRIVQSCILPLKRVEIDCKTEYDKSTKVNDKGETYLSKKKATIDLKKYVDDIYKIKLIEYEDTNGDASKLQYRKIGDFLEVANKDSGSIVIYYYPKKKTIEYYYQNSQEDYDNINELDLNSLDIDDNLLSMIPYFVKADLLEHDKPSEATLARNLFEQYLANFEVSEIEVKQDQKSWWKGML